MVDNSGLNDKSNLSLIDKIKLLVGIKDIASQVEKVSMPDKSAASIWVKLDGTKSITGLLLIIAYYALPQFGVKVPDIFLKIGMAWAGVGFAHKFDKATGLISAIAIALTRTNETINGEKK